MSAPRSGEAVGSRDGASHGTTCSWVDPVCPASGGRRCDTSGCARGWRARFASASHRPSRSHGGSKGWPLEKRRCGADRDGPRHGWHGVGDPLRECLAGHGPVETVVVWTSPYPGGGARRDETGSEGMEEARWPGVPMPVGRADRACRCDCSGTNDPGLVGRRSVASCADVRTQIRRHGLRCVGGAWGAADGEAIVVRACHRLDVFLPRPPIPLPSLEQRPTLRRVDRRMTHGLPCRAVARLASCCTRARRCIGASR